MSSSSSSSLKRSYSTGSGEIGFGTAANNGTSTSSSNSRNNSGGVGNSIPNNSNGASGASATSGGSVSTFTRVIYLAILVVLSLNLLLLSRSRSVSPYYSSSSSSLDVGGAPIAGSQHYIRIGSDFFSSYTPVQETVSHNKYNSHNNNANRRTEGVVDEVTGTAAAAAATSSSADTSAAAAAATEVDIDSTTTTTTTTTKARVKTVSSSSPVNGGTGTANNPQQTQFASSPHPPPPSPIHPPRVLMGVFSSDSYNDASYRTRHRTLFNDIWGNDPRLCSLEEYRSNTLRPSKQRKQNQQNNMRRAFSKLATATTTTTNTTSEEDSSTGGAAEDNTMTSSSVRKDCRVIYTFIMGGNFEKDAPKMRLESTDDEPLVLQTMRGKKPSRDDIITEHDVTLLNIAENMNDGKSPSFLAFATEVMAEFENIDGDNGASSIDYAMKLDADAILHYHDFLMFMDQHLPPAPYNTNIFVGALRDKAGWPKDIHPPSELVRLESFWGNEFEGVHLYLAGQTYILSRDLCHFVVEEAPYADKRIAPGGYLEGHEDHDVSSMAWHSPTPLHMITIGKSQRFWEHPVKGQPRWMRIEKRERARVSQQLFEGKKLRLY